MKRLIVSISCLLALSGASAHAGKDADSSPNLDLLLRCDGVGSRTVSDTTTVNASNDAGATASANATTYRKEQFDERLLLDFRENDSRIRVPRSLTPPINSGGKDGWWPLSDIKVSDDAIVARFRLNPLNKVTVRIDRGTGDVDVGGLGLAFRGVCERQDRSERRF